MSCRIEPLEPRTMLSAAPPLPAPDHVIIVMEENHAYSQVIGSALAPYINSLAKQGASFTNAHGVLHPSQPNYLALFSGSHLVWNDKGPLTFKGPDLSSELKAAGHTFAGYSEDLPATGSMVLTSGSYARRHNPWSD